MDTRTPCKLFFQHHHHHRDMAAGPSRQPPVQPPSTTPSDTYESVKFIVGGRECYALSWLLETASSVIANRIMAASLAADPGTRFQSVTVPPVPGLEPARQHALFGMAVEWLYSGGSVEPPAEALIDLWAMAAVLQVGILVQLNLNVNIHCSDHIANHV